MRSFTLFENYTLYVFNIFSEIVLVWHLSIQPKPLFFYKKLNKNLSQGFLNTYALAYVHATGIIKLFIYLRVNGIITQAYEECV